MRRTISSCRTLFESIGCPLTYQLISLGAPLDRLPRSPHHYSSSFTRNGIGTKLTCNPACARSQSLFVTFVALLVMKGQQQPNFVPRPTAPMPAVNVP